jgi:hypothetical protein
MIGNAYYCSKKQKNLQMELNKFNHEKAIPHKKIKRGLIARLDRLLKKASQGFLTYKTPLLSSRPHMRLKNIFIIKNLSSGAGWSAGLLIFPMLCAHAQPDERFFTAFIYMFAMVMTYEIIT